MKTIVAAILLSLLPFLVSAQEQSMTFTSTQVCARLVQFGPTFVRGKIDGKTKDEQIVLMDSVLKEQPVLKIFEPGFHKMLDALYDSDSGKTLTKETVDKVAPSFLQATYMMCMQMEAQGWIQQVPGLLEFKRQDPGDESPAEQPKNPAPNNKFKRPRMSSDIEV